ncbi:hypothetical protein ACAX43_31620 [Paraburkholderia sp. IW21]|uniref:hypothetical protein n=1 Tax=Paraburkholderia sp. IW21 TaxID=3242488 RepID=UPI003520E813
MSEPSTSAFFEKFESEDLGEGLPPMFQVADGGAKKWKHLDQLDFDLIGYLLSCHLVVEHYINEFLKTHFPELDWQNKDAKMNFAQRAALLTTWGERLGQPFNPVPTIKRLNSLRNKFGHQLDYTLTADDMKPFIDFLHGVSPWEGLKQATAKQVLHWATWCCCASLMRAIGEQADNGHVPSPEPTR